MMPTVSVQIAPTTTSLSANMQSKMVLRFTNPQESPVHVHLSIEKESQVSVKCEVTSFTITQKEGDMTDYKEEEDIQPSEKSTTIYQKKENLSEFGFISGLIT